MCTYKPLLSLKQGMVQCLDPVPNWQFRARLQVVYAPDISRNNAGRIQLRQLVQLAIAQLRGQGGLQN